MEQEKLKIPVRKGTQAIYDALATRDAGIIYILTDVAEGNSIFLGDIPLGKVCRQPVKYVLFDRTAQIFTFACADGTTETVDLVLDGAVEDGEDIRDILISTRENGAKLDATVALLQELAAVVSGKLDAMNGTLQEMAAAMLTKADIAGPALPGQVTGSPEAPPASIPAKAPTLRKIKSNALLLDGNGSLRLIAPIAPTEPEEPTEPEQSEIILSASELIFDAEGN